MHRLGRDGVVYEGRDDINNGSMSNEWITNRYGQKVFLVPSEQLDPMERETVKRTPLGNRLVYDPPTARILNPDFADEWVSETKPEPEKIEVKWIINGQIIRDFTPEDNMNLVLNHIKNADDVRAAASAWLTSFTNQVSEIISEQDAKEDRDGRDT